MLRPRDLAPAIMRLRGSSLLTLDRLDDAQLELEAVPGWTVADVFRHLADSDRGSVRGVHLAEFLPGRDLAVFEDHNDDNLARLRARDRATLRRELEVWGRRLARVVGLVPAPVARRRVPTAFGRLPLGWLAGLRLYDEWVHQWDVARALGDVEPPMDVQLRGLLADFHLLALRAQCPDRGPGVVEVRVADGPRRRFGAATPDAAGGVVALDVASLCLVAADRVPWRRLVDAGRIDLDDDALGSGAALLDACRVV